MHPYAPFAVHAKPNTRVEFAVNAGSSPAQNPVIAAARLEKSFMQGSVRTVGLRPKVQNAKQFYPEALDSARMTVYILELAESGLSMNDIAKQVQLSKTAVRNRMRAFLPQRALIPDLIEEIEV